MKKRIVSLLLTLLTILSLLPTAAMAAESTGVGITPVTDPNLWTTRLNSQGQSYSYRPPTAAGRQLYCMDLGYSYRYGTESFLQSYTYRSATGADADELWNDAVAETGLGEMDAITQENVKWMMSYIADYTGEIPGSLFMALQTYIWDNQSDKSAGGDPSGDIDAGGFANADTYDQYVEYYNWLLGQKANEDAEFQRQIEEYAAQGIRASIVEDESSKWAVLATSSVSGRQSFFAYHSDRKIVTSDEPKPGDPDEPVAGDGDITFQKVIAGTDRGLDGAVYNIYLDGQIVGSDVTSGGGYIEVHDVTEGLWSFVEQEAPAGYALDPTPHSVYVSVTDGDRQYTVTAEDEELPGIKVIKTSAADGSPVENAVYSPGRMGAPWWRTSPPAFISSVRSQFRSRLCGLPVSRPSPSAPARSVRHGLRTTPGPASKLSRKILPTDLPSRGSPTRSDRSTGISWTPWKLTPMAGSLSARSRRPSLWSRALPGRCAFSTRSSPPCPS